MDVAIAIFIGVCLVIAYLFRYEIFGLFAMIFVASEKVKRDKVLQAPDEPVELPDNYGWELEADPDEEDD